MRKAPSGALPVEQSPKSNSARQAEFRKKKSAGGAFKRGDVWAHPDDWGKIRALEEELRCHRVKINY